MIVKKSVNDALNLPPIPDEDDLYTLDSELSTELHDEVDVEQAKESMKQLKEYREQLKDIPDITKRKSHLDRLAKLAEDKFYDVFDRAYNTEDRFASELIKAANDILKIALDAHAKVIDSDIKLMDMQIKKDKMEIDINMKNKPKEIISKSTSQSDDSIEGEKVVGVKSRNEMLAQMKNK